MGTFVHVSAIGTQLVFQHAGHQLVLATSGKLKNTFLHFFTLFCKKVKKV